MTVLVLGGTTATEPVEAVRRAVEGKSLTGIDVIPDRSRGDLLRLIAPAL